MQICECGCESVNECVWVCDRVYESVYVVCECRGVNVCMNVCEGICKYVSVGVRA